MPRIKLKDKYCEIECEGQSIALLKEAIKLAKKLKKELSIG